MLTPNLSNRLKYLDQAARTLVPSSSSVSAFLESQYDRILADNNLQVSGSRRRAVCGGCGQIIIPGWSCRALRKPRRMTRRRALEQCNGGTGEKVDVHENRETRALQCDRCHAIIHGLQPRHPSKNRPLIANSPRPVHAKMAPAAPSEIRITAEKETTSKKRTRARKQSGLQALLVKSKESSLHQIDFGLSLMDIMRVT